jgi:hypothetical protein
MWTVRADGHFTSCGCCISARTAPAKAPEALCACCTPPSLQRTHDAPAAPTAEGPPREPGDSETFSQYVTRTKGREEAIRLTAIIDEQRRAFPDLMAMTALVRAMADRLASPLRCPICDCPMFVGFHEHATEEDDGPICPVCKPAAATHYLNTP